MKKIFKYIVLGVFITAAYSCDEDATSNSVDYVTFESSPTTFRVAENATSTKDVMVYAGNKTGSDRTYSVLVNEGSTLATSYSVPSTVTIPANSNVGVLPVSVTDDANLQYVAQTLIVEFAELSGASLGGSLTINVAEDCPNTIATLSITMDNYPDETTWSLTDGGGSEVAAGGPYDNPADDFVTYSWDFCLASGTYTLEVNDSWGDGGPAYDVSVGGASLVSGTVSGTGNTETFTID
ncbi:hypothetical protein [Winogradskyella sp. PG-2]|uniref:hypothetical protein n=1 Tax=Winogradskyella sp. PG-2 TaxID=754409 RepID=UPI0004588665|nr:hypothetical protein [Winogradskyella sp. PG-2]BAO74863.1 endonuclease I [Winogradskyella sp. PG-2]